MRNDTLRLRRRHFAALLAGLAMPGLARAAPPGLVFIGTRQQGPAGTIAVAGFDEASGRLTPLPAQGGVAMPGWLLADPRAGLLYAASETGDGGTQSGQVVSLAIGAGGTLSPLSAVSSAGGGATFIALDAGRHLLFVADYGAGRIAALPVLSQGRLGPAVAVAQDTGHGPSPRQKTPHAHQAVLSPGGNFVLVPDLGADRVFIYRLAQYGAPALSLAGTLALPPGSGPRRLVFSASGHFAWLLTELTAQLFTLRWEEASGQLRILGQQGLAAPGAPGPHSGGELLAAPGGRGLYASLRGASSELLVYDCDPRTGAALPVQRLGSGGRAPWSFGLSPSGAWLLVANEQSGTVNLFARTAAGLLRPRPAQLRVPHPCCVAFA